MSYQVHNFPPTQSPLIKKALVGGNNGPVLLESARELWVDNMRFSNCVVVRALCSHLLLLHNITRVWSDITSPKKYRVEDERINGSVISQVPLVCWNHMHNNWRRGSKQLRGINRRGISKIQFCTSNVLWVWRDKINKPGAGNIAPIRRNSCCVYFAHSWIMNLSCRVQVILIVSRMWVTEVCSV